LLFTAGAKIWFAKTFAYGPKSNSLTEAFKDTLTFFLMAYVSTGAIA